MQFPTSLALLGLTTLAAAVPIEERTSKPAPDYCCPKGKTSSCSVCPSSGKCPSGSNKLSSCSNNAILGLINVVVCDVLNDLTVAIPISIDIL